MKKLFAIIIICLIISGIYAQNFIGMHKFDVTKTMKEKMNSFSLDNSSSNSTYKYLKYVDSYGDETILYFLSANDYCTSSRLISDYANLKYRKKQLNANYKKVDDSTWEYEDDGDVFEIKLKKEEWFFVITTKKKE